MSCGLSPSPATRPLTKELSARQVKHPEAVESLLPFQRIIAFLLRILPQCPNSPPPLIPLILLPQPILTRLSIMPPINPPQPLKHHVLLEMQEQVVARHGPAREEVLSHPAVGLLEVVGSGAVAEDVDEEEGFVGGAEPGGYFGEEEGVVFHLWERGEEGRRGERRGEEGRGGGGGELKSLGATLPLAFWHSHARTSRC